MLSGKQLKVQLWMGVCSGSGFLHAIERGQRIDQKASYFATSSKYERRRNIPDLHKSEYYPEGQIFSCSYANSIFKLCEIDALKTMFLTFLKFKFMKLIN